MFLDCEVGFNCNHFAMLNTKVEFLCYPGSATAQMVEQMAINLGASGLIPRSCGPSVLWEDTGPNIAPGGC